MASKWDEPSKWDDESPTQIVYPSSQQKGQGLNVGKKIKLDTTESTASNPMRLLIPDKEDYGATAGALGLGTLGYMLAPTTGGLSLAVPALMAALGAGAGEAAQQKVQHPKKDIEISPVVTKAVISGLMEPLNTLGVKAVKKYLPSMGKLATFAERKVDVGGVKVPITTIAKGELEDPLAVEALKQVEDAPFKAVDKGYKTSVTTSNPIEGGSKQYSIKVSPEGGLSGQIATSGGLRDIKPNTNIKDLVHDVNLTGFEDKLKSSIQSGNKLYLEDIMKYNPNKTEQIKNKFIKEITQDAKTRAIPVDQELLNSINEISSGFSKNISDLKNEIKLEQGRVLSGPMRTKLTGQDLSATSVNALIRALGPQNIMSGGRKYLEANK